MEAETSVRYTGRPLCIPHDSYDILGLIQDILNIQFLLMSYFLERSNVFQFHGFRLYPLSLVDIPAIDGKQVMMFTIITLLSHQKLAFVLF